MYTILILIVIGLLMIVMFLPRSVFQKRKPNTVKNAGFIEFRVGQNPTISYRANHQSIEIKEPTLEPGYKEFAGFIK